MGSLFLVLLFLYSPVLIAVGYCWYLDRRVKYLEGEVSYWNELIHDLHLGLISETIDRVNALEKKFETHQHLSSFEYLLPNQQCRTAFYSGQ